MPPSQDAWKKWERQQASKRSSSSTKGPKGDSTKGGNKPGKVCPDVPSTPKAESPGRLRLVALESGFSSFRKWKWPPCSRVSRGASRRPTPQIPKSAVPVIVTGVLTVARFVPHRNWRTPLLANSPGLLGPSALPLIGGAPGCDLSDPSHMMEPRGTTSHTVTAMDPWQSVERQLY